MGEPLRILMTNTFVANRSGSELYVRDVALALQARGYQPIIFSTRLGELAAELRRRSIMVTDDLATISQPPDLIHGQHHLETMAALLHFPNVPCLSVIHGWLPWQEMPVHFPRVCHYVAVSQTVYDSLTTERGIPPEKITILPNFVDLERFQARVVPLPEQPRRAAIFSGVLGGAKTFAIVQEACQQRGISLDAFGSQAGNVLTNPEKVLASYDVVFSIGRAAIECLALGTAVIVARPSGIVGQVTRANYEALRRLNFDFGAEVPPQPLTVESVGAALDAYDPIEAHAVSQRIRAEADIQQAIDRLTVLYDQVVQDWTTHAPIDPLVEMRLTSAYLTWFTSHYVESYVQQIGQLERDSLARHQLLEQARLHIAKVEEESEARMQEIEQARLHIAKVEQESEAWMQEIEQARLHIAKVEEESEARMQALEQARLHIAKVEEESEARMQALEQARLHIAKVEQESESRMQALEQARLHIAKVEQESESRMQALEQARLHIAKVEQESFERYRLIEELQNHIRGLESALEERTVIADNAQARAHEMETKIARLQEKLSAAEQREQAHADELAAQQQTLIQQHQAEQEALEARLAEAQTAIDRLQRKLAYYRDLI